MPLDPNYPVLTRGNAGEIMPDIVSPLGGIIAYSLALSPKVAALGSYALIPAQWHAPLRQRMVLTRKAGPVAARFYDFMQQPAARAVLRKYGFVLPGEAS